MAARTESACSYPDNADLAQRNRPYDEVFVVSNVDNSLLPVNCKTTRLIEPGG